MEAEFSVELDAEDPTLALPWNSPDGSITYIDLRSSPEAVDQVQEVRDFPELRELLLALNVPASPYQTAKCDVWFDTLMDVNDEPYDATIKCASYLDICFAGSKQLATFAEHELQARGVVHRLRQPNDLAARAELIVRRAYFEAEQGFYWTIYLFGYGDEIATARDTWGAALTHLRTALQV